MKVSQCNTIGELVRLIPVPVQPVSRDIIDGVYQASQKLGGAEALLAFWKDKLQSSDFAAVSQLNSLRAPTVQISKEAIGDNDGGLGSMTLDTVLHEAKRNALTHMILIKGKEVQNLQNFVHPRRIGSRLHEAWAEFVQQHAGSLTGEHSTLLLSDDFVLRVSQVTGSIGESSYQRARIAKDKRSWAKKEADINMTDVSGVENQKQLMTLVEEALRRRGQSQRDRATSGKGKRSSAISKKKTQGAPKIHRPGKGKNGKRASGRQQKRR